MMLFDELFDVEHVVAEAPLKKIKRGVAGAQAKTAAQRAAAAKNRRKSPKGKKISQKLRNKPKSAAHKKAIARGMKRYWAAYKKSPGKFPKRKVRKSRKGASKKPAAKKTASKKKATKKTTRRKAAV